MSENHRGPEVPEAEVPVVERPRWPCKDYLRGTCNNSFCENWETTLQNACSTRPRSVVGLGKSAHSHIVRLMNSRRKGLKRMMAKSAVAMLKKGNWQEREYVTDGCHDRPGKPGKRGDKKLGQNSSKRQSSGARQLGCVFQDMDAAEVYSPEGHRHAEANPTCEVHKGNCTSYQNSRPISFARIYLPRWNLISVAPTLQNLRIGLRRRQSGKSKVPREAALKLAKSVLKLKEHQRAAFFSPSKNRCFPASTLN